ncbi:MAG TPA: condensation domain-containing protein [Trebonia sp.]|nr:condensation domain-containing protein [Trebonia sp.]
MVTGPMDRTELEFHADTSGTFPMTWGQQDFWRKKIRPYGDASWHFNLHMFIDLPDDIAADQAMVAAALRRLVERNEVLRTHFLDGPKGLLQRVARTGTISLLVCQAPQEASRDRAEALGAELAAAPFNLEAEWGIRFALVCAGQAPRYLAFAVSHVVADGGGILALLTDFVGLLRAQGGGSEPDLPWQPADQVHREQSERDIRRNKAAVRYWRKQLERMPPSVFPWAVPPQEPRFHRLRPESRALGVAAARLAAGCQVSVPSALLAGAALALTGQPTCVLVVVAGNHYDADMRAMVRAASQDGLLVADLNGETVAEAVRAVHGSITAALFYGHYDPA